MGPFSTRSCTVSYARSLRDTLVRSSSRHFSLATRSLSYSLPRSAAITFGLDVMHADAEIALSPCSTEDRSLYLLRSASMTTLWPDNTLPLIHWKIARSACSDLLRWRHCSQTKLSPRSTEDRSLCLLRSAVITTLRPDNALSSLHRSFFLHALFQTASISS